MNKIIVPLFSAVCALSCTNTYASRAEAGIGAKSTLGNVSSEHSVSTGLNNPAAGMLMISDDEKWRINYFPSFGAEVEIGTADNFQDELDDLIDFIDDPSDFEGSLEETRVRFNNVLVDLGENGYVRGVAAIQLPLFPFYVKALGGTLSFDARLDAHVTLEVLDDELTINQQQQISTSTSLYVKGGEGQTFSVGYSREFDFSGKLFPKNTNFYAGANFSVTRLALSKQLAWIEDLGVEDTASFIEDQYDNNQNTTTNVDLDLGFILDAKRYRIGLTIANLFSPKFDFGEIGNDCGTLVNSDTTSVSEINSCFIAREFAQQGRIDLTETHERNTLPTLDGILKLSSRWNVNGAIDLVSFNDISGFEYQLLTISTDYRPDTAWLPNMRVGYRKNLVGFETSSVSLGFTFLNSLELDLLYGLESATADDTTVPRTLGFSLAISESF